MENFRTIRGRKRRSEKQSAWTFQQKNHMLYRIPLRFAEKPKNRALKQRLQRFRDLLQHEK